MLFSRKKKLFCGILSLILVLSLAPVKVFAASEEELDRLKVERDALVRQRQTQQKLVNDLRQGDDVMCACHALMADLDRDTARKMQMDYRALGGFWRYIKARGDARYSVGALARELGLSPYQVACALGAFDELELITAEFDRGMVNIRFLAEKKVELSDSALLARVERAAK